MKAPLALLSNSKVIGIVIASVSVIGLIITYQQYRNNKDHQAIEQVNLKLEKQIKELQLEAAKKNAANGLNIA